jgi:hypothetical protein
MEGCISSSEIKKKQTCKPKLLYPSKLTFIIKEKLKPSIISKN